MFHFCKFAFIQFQSIQPKFGLGQKQYAFCNKLWDIQCCKTILQCKVFKELRSPPNSISRNAKVSIMVYFYFLIYRVSQAKLFFVFLWVKITWTKGGGTLKIYWFIYSPSAEVSFKSEKIFKKGEFFSLRGLFETENLTVNISS